MKSKQHQPELSESSRFNMKAMRTMNIIAISVFILAIIYKVFFDK
ncbi:DUF6728 family protein [Sphingobacterium deserti]|uniref:Uncharacterized protein n=1 Tax=Sphingobacterium deserti TaxID=1229276 RepID=A0A0B8T8X9_9SPHI|nr:DUF6728 family protein [Sphingobacterium deserti]KGE14420.1 hypothetical protein DI53_1847 [Sphingobacterium deserti]